ncbi:MAG: extracellular solute-binding protein [Thermomicrobiales bacterium]
MPSRDQSFLTRSVLSRRDLTRFGIGAAGGTAVGAHLSLGAVRGAALHDGDSIVFISSQLVPIEEAEKMRNVILADFEGEVEFLPEDPGPFVDRITAEAQAGEGTIGVIGGLHGDFALLAAQGLLADLTDIAADLMDRGFSEEFLNLGKLGTEQQLYLPWMQATYIMAAHNDAMEFLPEGADVQNLTYEQLGQWATAINDSGAGQKFGLPAGEDGLLHRFLQGYAYPSFTGGVNTTFRSAEAVQMWEWLRSIWEQTNPQSTTYGFMQEPLRSGEVTLAWDHTARLIEALRANPEDFVTFPSPRGPSGLGFMPVVVGLAIPNTAPDIDASMSLIEYLTRPEVQVTTLQEVAFFPVVTTEEITDLDAGTQLEADAVAAQTAAEGVVPSLLPVGLGEQNGAYNKVFRDAFQQIILDGDDIQTVLDEQAQILQEVLTSVDAACWPPDPASDGVCQVG